jgi:hypothetical protein
VTRLALRAGARVRIALLAGIGLIAAAAVALAVQRPSGPAAPAGAAGRPSLMLLTSLPLIFPEQFGLDGGGSAALTALETRFRVVPVDTVAADKLTVGPLLLMAHPPAQTAEALVDLDAWVRAGGRLLLLADPALEWHSDRPLGDLLRPPPAFADTGLLSHWGLRLDAPEQRGPRLLSIGAREVMTNSPGILFGAACRIGADGLTAHCRIGKGRVTVIADADFLDVDRPEGLDGPTRDNLPALLGELTSLGSGRADSPGVGSSNRLIHKGAT